MYTNLLGLFLSYDENWVLWIRFLKSCNLKLAQQATSFVTSKPFKQMWWPILELQRKLSIVNTAPDAHDEQLPTLSKNGFPGSHEAEAEVAVGVDHVSASQDGDVVQKMLPALQPVDGVLGRRERDLETTL